jgi:hypothetical protein
MISYYGVVMSKHIDTGNSSAEVTAPLIKMRGIYRFYEQIAIPV